MALFESYFIIIIVLVPIAGVQTYIPLMLNPRDAHVLPKLFSYE
jgi:hypothetical protein